MMRKQDLGKVATYAVVFGLVGGITFEGVNYTAGRLTGNAAVESTASPASKLKMTSTSASGSDETSGTVSGVAANVLPSIVAIDVTVQEQTEDVFGRTYSQEGSGSGSGIIVAQDDNNLYIATNNHVVKDATSVSVKFNDDSVYTASVKGTDTDSDLAVVEIPMKDLSSDTKNNIKVATLGDSTKVKIGEQSIAIGNALGYGTSVTVGYISAVDREVASEDVNMKLLQTDAAINPGNSGGALLNMQGELIGINSAKAAATEVEGMGYAIPVSVAQPILDELMNRETRYKTDEEHAGYIGVTCLNVDSTSAQTYGIPLGAFVDSVEEGGPAQTAGIQKGDVIVKFDGMTVSGNSDLVGKLEYYQAGETVEVVISRAQNGEYQEQTVSVTLGKKSEMKQADPQQGK